MEKQIILSKLVEYLKKKNIKVKKSGKVIMLQCPFCNKEPMSANKIPNTSIINCFHCKKKYNLIDIARKLDYGNELKEEEVLHKIKEFLNLNVVTSIDKKNIEKYLDFYGENGFDLVPIARNKKIPVEKDWTNKTHKDKEEWKNWIVNDLNIGVKTGIRSNVTIIDIDQKPIPEEIKNLMGKTLTQESTHGFHLIYKYDSEFPKTRIDSLKVDIENDGGQVVIYPSTIDNVQRKIENLIPIIEIPKELKEFLMGKITVPRKTQSEEIREDIETGDFKIDPKKFILKNNNLDGNCNTEFIKLGGILRKQLNSNQTGYVLNVLNNHMLENPMQQRAIKAMIRELDKYNIFDEKELAHKILEHLKETDEMSRTEMAMTIVGTNRGEDKKRVDKALRYLVKEGCVTKKGSRYNIIKKANWKETLMNIGIPIDFKMPYFYDIMNFNFGDLILIGSRNATGKTHISMNIIKQLVEQGIKPYYLSLESGSRWAKIGLQLGLKEGDFKWDELSDATQIQLEKKAITVIDWLCPTSYAETDKLLKYFVEQLQKTNGVAIIFMQLRENNEWFAKDLAKQFPSFACRYVYDSEDSGEYGKFLMHPSKDKVREAKTNIRIYEIPCKYDWETKVLKRIDEVEKENERN